MSQLNKMKQSKLAIKTGENASQARKMLFVNLLVYVIISLAELEIGTLDHSVALVADGENNFTGIVSVLSLIVGLTFSKRPSDDYHVEGHWQYENLAVFLAGITMFIVGLSCLWNGGVKLINLANGRIGSQLNGRAAYMAIISAVCMLGLSIINEFVSHKLTSASLAASARDFFSDSLTSFGTMLAIAGATFLHIDWVDSAAAILLGGFIIYNGSKILSTSAAKLSNGFSPTIRKQMVKDIQAIPGAGSVTFIDVRYSGNNLVVTAEIELAGETKVVQSYRLCKEIEQLLQRQYPILYCYIQVRPKNSG